MKKLAQYIESNGITKVAFAKSIGTSRFYIHDLISGRRAPSVKMMLKIEEVTKGRIKAKDWTDAAREKRKASEAKQ